MKKIWIINQYNMPPEYGHLNRHYNFGKYLYRLGYEPTVFVGSFLHNTNRQMINDGNSITHKYEHCEFPYYFIKTCDYSKSRVKRVYAMYEFYRNLLKATKNMKKPDVILGSSAHPLVAIAAIRLAEKYNCQSIVEVRDLWPESFVAYNILKENNPILKLLYVGEKWIYEKADKLIFTMEGGKDYLLEKGWDNKKGGSIDMDKVFHINNGVDLEVFNKNKNQHVIKDSDLDDNSYYKVVYVGSLRKANVQIWKLFDAIQLMKGPIYKNIKFLIYGDGSERNKIEEYCKKNKLENVVVKGFVEKKYIASILARCDLNILNCSFRSILKYGGSQNKLFDYLASSNPIITGEDTKYSIVKNYNCGVAKNFKNSMELKEAILTMKNLDDKEKINYRKRILEVASEYDFENLTKRLIDIIEYNEVEK